MIELELNKIDPYLLIFIGLLFGSLIGTTGIIILLIMHLAFSHKIPVLNFIMKIYDEYKIKIK